MSFEEPKHKELPHREWYERAREKAETFLPDLDSHLHVEVDIAHIVDDEGEGYDTFVLKFRHDLTPMLKWTMSILPNETYIEHEFEGIIRKIYMDYSMKETTH